MERFTLAPTPFAGRARAAPPDSAFVWLRHGWAIFTAKPGTWIAMTVLLLIAIFGLRLAPVVGEPLADCLLPLLSAGALHGAARLGDEGRLDITDLFAGLRQNSASLVIVGLVLMAGLYVTSLVVKLIVGGSVAGGVVLGATGQFGGGFGVLIGGYMFSKLILLVLAGPLLMAACYAPALVFFNGMAPIPALQASFFAIARNWLPMAVLALIVAALAFFAALPVLLGFLVLIPVLYGTLYASYRDIFIA